MATWGSRLTCTPGPMTYVQHTGDRPMRILWKLHNPLPADIFHAARVAAG